MIKQDRTDDGVSERRDAVVCLEISDVEHDDDLARPLLPPRVKATHEDVRILMKRGNHDRGRCLKTALDRASAAGENHAEKPESPNDRSRDREGKEGPPV